VNEQGSEGAAASSLTISFRSAPSDEEQLIFVADRPFLFALVDKANGLILFLGRFVYP
uniref:Serpin domain-containing protein n=1 Tax=Romanomermis culicivorax TaxID=13658 RepID=A0A915I5E8_ROMCU